jgi:hypothetical protein
MRAVTYSKSTAPSVWPDRRIKMADALVYPLINGFRHGFSSITLIFNLSDGKTVQMFCKSINYGRTRSRDG